MKKLNFKCISLLFAMAFFFSGCYKMQKDYEYVKYELDPHINMTAKEFLLTRGEAPTVANDTIFKWMKLGIDYAGIDLAEYEKPGRTYIFLHNSAVRTLSSGKVNGGFFFRLSSVRLSYRFKPALARKAFMKNVSVYVYGINLLTWTDYTGYDPEFSSSNALQPGDDNGKYPKRRELGLGLNVQF